MYANKGSFRELKHWNMIVTRQKFVVTGDPYENGLTSPSQIFCEIYFCSNYFTISHPTISNFCICNGSSAFQSVSPFILSHQKNNPTRYYKHAYWSNTVLDSIGPWDPYPWRSYSSFKFYGEAFCCPKYNRIITQEFCIRSATPLIMD